MRITNNSGISLPLAVWLAYDDYDYVQGVENYISVTTLMKPLRQIILPSRIPTEARTMDVEEAIQRSLGHAIHDSMEKAWLKGAHRVLRQLGHPDGMVNRVAINPTDEERLAHPDMIPVYLEQRMIRQFGKHNIGGKYDMAAEGVVNDTKSTSVWGWIKGTRDDDHRIQMSLYRWIDAQLPANLRRITEDYGRVNYVFTDWSKAQARSVPNYPRRVEHKDILLFSLEETEHWIRNKLELIEQYKDRPEIEIPQCTDEELWRSAPAYKYFSDPEKAKVPGARSTRTFDDLVEARKFQAEKGGKGVIVTIPGEVKACGYCAGFDACTQKDQYQ